ncbi:MAG: hypothetical protein J2P45_13095, partial [Candidatus Dormibacteraeota bacterium]|nr:hypothetical protein [Candidatus Dormibacteraeota bacterium]
MTGFVPSVLPERQSGAGWGGRHAVELYVRTYSTMLQSSGEIRLDSLEQAHLRMGSALHPLAAEPRVDMGAFLYAVRRLPNAILRARRVVLGQSARGFRSVLGADVYGWERVKAPARRRSWYYDGAETLAVLLASPSDIDDLVPTLVAFQIEWNKLHDLLRQHEGDLEDARERIGSSADDWERLREAWGEAFEANLAAIRESECHVLLRMISGSHIGYARSAARWWQPIQATIDEMGLGDAPVYFCSSNLHSLVNVLSGVARRFEPDIIDHTRRTGPEMIEELERLESGRTRASRDNWLYYAARGLFDGHPHAAEFRSRRTALEREMGIVHVPPQPMGIDSAAQVVRLASLDPSCVDPRVGSVDPEALRASRAALVNIDYPLGLAAYHLLRQIAESV